MAVIVVLWALQSWQQRWQSIRYIALSVSAQLPYLASNSTIPSPTNTTIRAHEWFLLSAAYHALVQFSDEQFDSLENNAEDRFFI
ncbi:hypothetical protein BDQ17DRAFT_520835 [Cyathus striatus]|nr:hypothetical protein BDQ17DRAFT_520835 [Cyathus striatus]